MGDSLLHCSHDEDVTEDDSSEAGDAEDNMETGDEVERSEDETQQTEEGKKQSEDEAQQAQKGKELLADTSEMTAEQKGSQRELTKLLSEKAKMKAGLAQLNKLIHENKQASQELRKRKRNEDHSSEAEACDNTETGDEHSGCQEKRSKISPTSPDVSTDVEIIGCETTPKVGTLKTGHGNSSVEDGPMDLSQKAAQSDSVSEEEVAAQVGSVDLSQRPALSDAVSKEEATLLRDFDYLVSAFPNIKREQMQIMLRQHKNDANRVDTITDIVLNRKSPDPTSRPTEGLQKCASPVLPGSASGASVSLPSTSGTQHHSEARGDRVVAARTSLVAGPSSALEAAASGASGASHGLKQPNDSIEDLWNDTRAVVDGVKSVQPDAAVDVGVLVELCRKHSGPGRIPRVIDELLSRVQKQRELRKAEKPQYVTESPVEVKANDSLYKDLHTLMGMFPARNQDEMYAYLEVHRDRADRVERVVEELVGTASDVEELNAGSEMMPKNLWKKPTLLEELKMLTEMFPACDPSFLENSLQAKSQDPERVQTIATELSNGKPYPKLKDKIARERKEAARRRLWNLDLNVDDFLDKFPDPVKAFNNTEKPVGASYREHCFVKLRNEFPRLRSGFIRNVMEKFKHHLTPSWEELLIKANFAENRFSKKFRSGPLRDHMPYPQEPDEVFFHEVWFFEHQQEVLACLEEKKQMRLSKVNEAKANNELCTCQICFDDEILLEEMQHCDDGHMYCQDCISRYAQTRIAEALFTFPCLEESCKSKFPLEVLKKVLPPNTLSILLVRLVEQSVKEAGIPDLVTCPFCPFATIMPNPDDKVFKCQNPDCLKESCRLCHEPNHIPFRCNEVEKSGEVAMRTFIENRISEAMLRTCPTCKRRFFKEHGCNKMKCHCGTTMCYVCREPNIDYQHFQDGRCKLDSFGEDKLHKEEMEKAAEEARKEYLEQHPEALGLTLKYDPDNHLKEFREMMMKKKHRRPGWGLLLGQMPQDDSDSESEEDESLTTSDSDDSDG